MTRVSIAAVKSLALTHPESVELTPAGVVGDRRFWMVNDQGRLVNGKLAPELMGKSFDVEDGFLKRIRVAQYQPGMTRVVLEVAPVSEYSAFLLPNPYRLIVDIHGQQPAASAFAGKERQTVAAEAPQQRPGTDNEAAVSSRSSPSVKNDGTTDAARKNPVISSAAPVPLNSKKARKSPSPAPPAPKPKPCSGAAATASTAKTSAWRR